MSRESSIASELAALFEAEGRVRQIHAALRSHPHTELLAAAREAITSAGACAPEEANVRLVCVARLLGELDGPGVVDALIDVLDSPHLDARLEAGEQLQGMALESFAEVAAGVRRALARLGPESVALAELPYVLLDTPEDGVFDLLVALLEHPNPNAAAAAIEALVQLGDPAAIEPLGRLAGDERTSVLGEDEGEPFEATLGDLAEQAVALLAEANRPSSEGPES